MGWGVLWLTILFVGGDDDLRSRMFSTGIVVGGDDDLRLRMYSAGIDSFTK
jgi:hypothetical protein